jgi:DNA polymerase-3 subunit alpha
MINKENGYFEYPCGCKFPVKKNQSKISLLFDPNTNNLNLYCSKTWDLISSGNTKGVFQLESRLGKSIAKKLKPENIEQLSALIAILRPGSLEAIREGKSVTNHYIDKKNGSESVDYYHPSLKPILATTYGEMIYQEQAMEIAKNIAGFNLQEADLLRKAIGKKKPEEMAKVKLKFLEGSTKQKIVSKEEAEQIFGWIEKSQRYSFNKSHSVSYALNAYLSAYTKAHFPRIFFASYLRFAKDKIDPQSEIKELVQNAGEMDIIVMPPDLRKINKLFILEDKKIYFGLTDIKGLGDSVFNKLLDISKNINFSSIKWVEMLLKVLLNINSTSAKALIMSGALDFFKKNRQEMLFEYNNIALLTQKEKEYLVNSLGEPYKSVDLLEKLLAKSKLSKNRKEIIENILRSLNKPPHTMTDNAEWISDSEYELLGCSITCSKVDLYDISMTNTTCKTFKNNELKQNIIIGGEIDNINIVKTKSGKNKGSEMAFVTLIDNSGSVDSIVFFPEQYKKYRNMLFIGNVVVLKGNRSKDNSSLLVEKSFVAQT